MQKFWDSTMALPLDDNDDSHSEGSTKFTSEGTEMGRLASYPHSSLSNNFGFKLEEKKCRMHRFNCETQSITNLVTSILQRVGDDIDRDHLPEILYEDAEHDKVLLVSDSDLVAVVEYARLSGWKILQILRLHLDYFWFRCSEKRWKIRKSRCFS